MTATTSRISPLLPTQAPAPGADLPLTGQERAADLDAESLSRLVGLVEHDVSADPFR